MKIQTQLPRVPAKLVKPEGPQDPQPPTPLKDALVHIGKEVSQEAIVGVALAGMVCVGDSLGYGGLSRAAVLALGAARGLYKYQDTASAAMQNRTLGTALAVTLGAGTAMLAGFSGNVLAGAACGGVLGLVQAPKSYPTR